MKRITPTLEDSLVLLKWVGTVLIVFVLIFILTGLRSLGEQSDRNHQTGLENNTYLRTTSCILSVPLEQRTDDYISNCYLRAEKASGVNVDHFGNK